MLAVMINGVSMVSELVCREQSCVLSDVFKCKDGRTALTRTYFK
jgi:hypothetical protein